MALYFASQGTGDMMWPVAANVGRIAIAGGGSLLAELRMLRPPEVMKEDERCARYDSLEGTIWLHLENGELDSSQHAMLLATAHADRRSPEETSGADRSLSDA